MPWSFLLTDRSGNVLDELAGTKKQITERKVRLPINRVPTGSFKARRDHPWINTFRSSDKVLIKALDDTGTLRAHGPIIGYSKVAQGGQKDGIQVNFAGVGWRLAHRLVAQSKTKTGWTPTSLDQGQIAAQIITGLNGDGVSEVTGSGDTGIRVGAITASKVATVGPWWYKNALEAIGDLAAPLDGFDWKITPTEPTPDATGLRLGIFTCAPLISATRPNVVWEYGDGKHNVAGWTEDGDSGGNMNRGYALPPGFPDNATQDVLEYHRADAILDRGAIYEDVLSNDLQVDALRLSLLQENVAIRRLPKTRITFTPVRSLAPGVVPQYGAEWVEGDIFTFRAVEYDQETVNALFRCYAVEFSLDDEGNANPSPVLISEDNT